MRKQPRPTLLVDAIVVADLRAAPRAVGWKGVRVCLWQQCGGLEWGCCLGKLLLSLIYSLRRLSSLGEQLRATSTKARQVRPPPTTYTGVAGVASKVPAS
jgi:hypothetical protein